MSPWITKNGKHIFIPDTPRSSVEKLDVTDNRIYVKPISDEEYDRFLKDKSDSLYRSYFEKAKTIIKTSAPIIASFDLSLATVYGLYRFTDYGFKFLYKVDQEYKTTQNYEKALRNVVERELEQHIFARFKDISIKKASAYAGKSLWIHYKAEFPNDAIPEEYDKYAENALIETFKEIGIKVF